MNDHELMTDFMSAMHNNEHAMMMMQNDRQIMMGHHDEENGEEMNQPHQMMDHTRMMNMLKDDPEMMQDMMGAMMVMLK